jgi:pyruvate dehydrogenase E2 component (dihydrolipoamide acetyltransferase)
MAFSVVMPALEMAQETGKLIAWRKREGDRVTKGEPLLEIETDKAVMEIEAPADGILAGVSAHPGSDIPVGHTIAWIVAPGEKSPAATDAEAKAPTARTKTESHAAHTATSTHEPSPSHGIKISPKARRLARESGIDISAIHGSGPGGEILASDIQASAAPTSKPTAHNKTANVELPTTLGRLMAERTTQSWTSVPHFFVSREVDATALNDHRAKLTAEIERTHKMRVTHTDLLIAITARILLKHPQLNSSWTAQGIRRHAQVYIGIAVAVDDGVVAIVIPNAHSATIVEIAQRRHDLSERARAGKLRPADIADATFTVSNLGMYHVDAFSAIIMPPQAAVLAVGSIADRVVAIKGHPTVRPAMTLTLSCDHRVIDGAHAAIFMNDLIESIRDPQKFLE